MTISTIGRWTSRTSRPAVGCRLCTPAKFFATIFLTPMKISVYELAKLGRLASLKKPERGQRWPDAALSDYGSGGGIRNQPVPGPYSRLDPRKSAFGANTTLGYSPNSNQAGGTLSLTDGTHSANIALLGNYMASSFVMESDNHGGTMVVAQASQTSTQTLLTSSQHA